MTRVTPFEPNGAVSREQFNLRVEEINEGIGEVAAQLGNIATVAVHSKAGTVHSLVLGAAATAGIQMVQFAATADYAEGDTWTVDGVAFAAKLQGEEGALADKYFVVGDMVSVMLDPAGKKLGFKSGGGGAKLNVFCQMTQPAAPDGVWVKTTDKPKAIKLLASGELRKADTWVTRTPMPIATYAAAYATVNNRNYCIGGFISGSDTINTNQVHDPATDTWTTAAPIPTARGSCAFFVIEDKIHVVCGESKSVLDLKTHEVHDPISNTWTTKASAPTAMRATAGASVKKRGYVIGGAAGANIPITRNANQVYDPISNTWTTGASMPTPRYYLTATSQGEKIYCICGYSNSDAITNINEAYDPSSNTWTTKASAPLAQRVPSSITLGGKIYSIGGDTAAINQVYDPISNTWTTKASAPTARRGASIGLYNDLSLCLIGGLSQKSQYLNTNEEFETVGVIFPDGTLALQNDDNGTKAKIIASKNADIYVSLAMPIFYKNGKPQSVEAAANYDNTGWKPIT